MGTQELTRDDVERVVRRTREGRDRDIGYLLGDPQRERPITIEDWVVLAREARMAKYDIPTYSQYTLMDMGFEIGCALVHDARPREARDVFQMIVAPEHRPSLTKILALLGIGRALNMWRRYAGAESSLMKAVNDSEGLDPILAVVARTLWALNRSDAGAVPGPRAGDPREYR